MNHKDFFSTIKNEIIGRPATWLGIPGPSAIPKLIKYFKCSSIEDLNIKLEDDVWPVIVPYDYPPHNDIYPIGLVFLPSHEAILQDINPANTEAMFNTIKEFQTT